MTGGAAGRLVYILGPGHCGSTLLDLLLSSHPQVFGAGELAGLHRSVALAYQTVSVKRRLRGSPEPLTDLADWVERTTHPFDHPIWKEAIACYERRFGQAFVDAYLPTPSWRTLRAWRVDDVRRWVEPTRILVECLRAASGATVITDASKVPQRLYLLHRSAAFDLSVIHLVRDGRAVVYSYLAKYGSMRIGVRRWLARMLVAPVLRRQIGPARWLQVRYEDLATSPASTVARVCEFLNVPYDPRMLQFRRLPYLGVGGNRLADRQEETIVLDERWKSQLGLSRRIAFALVGGWLNRLYGY